MFEHRAGLEGELGLEFPSGETGELPLKHCELDVGVVAVVDESSLKSRRGRGCDPLDLDSEAARRPRSA